MKPVAWVGQALLYGSFAAVLGVFSHWPSYRSLPPGEALVRLSMVHATQRMQPCRTLSEAELAKLPPNMRAPTQCTRERAPLSVEVEVDGRLVARETAQPSGLSRDGTSSVYRRWAVPAGEHLVHVRFKDSPSSAPFDRERTQKVVLRPSQILVIDYDPERGEVTLR